jgi:hypothetical protein
MLVGDIRDTFRPVDDAPRKTPKNVMTSLHEVTRIVDNRSRIVDTETVDVDTASSTCVDDPALLQPVDDSPGKTEKPVDDHS